MIRIIAFLAMTCPAAAHEVRCAEAATVTTMLVQKYGETALATGKTEHGPVTLWVNMATGTWTVALALPNGDLCLFVTGGEFRAAAPDPAGTLN